MIAQTQAQRVTERERVCSSLRSLSATYFTSRQSKCFSFFSCSLSLYLIFFCFSLKFTHYSINTYVYARSSSSSYHLLLLPPIVQLGQFLPINRGAISRTSAMRLPPFLGLRCPGFNFALLFMALRPAMVGEKCHRSMEGV